VKSLYEEGAHVIERAQDYWKKLGPGLTTGAADDDPSGIGTYSATGAASGLQLLWIAVFTFPLMAVVQEMCARIGLATGRGLASNIRAHYPRWVLYACTLMLFAANTFNIGVDLGAMAKGVQLLDPRLNFLLLVVFFAVASLILQIFTSYKSYARYLKYLALVLFAYVISAVFVHIDWRAVLAHSVVPSFTLSRDSIFLITAILGTTISPYLFFWQTSQEVEEEILSGRERVNDATPTTPVQYTGTTKEEVHNMRIDVWSGMLISNIVMFFIIVTCAATLFAHGITNITSAAQAAEALRPLAGNAAYLLFAIGIIGTGILSVPILAGAASYAISEGFGWREGLYRKFKQAHAFYAVIALSMVVGLLVNLAGLDPIKALIWSAVANGIIAPIVLFLIVRLSTNGQVMGPWKNGSGTTWIGWIITVVMAIAAVATIVSFL
jgi:NRAMP (natural resistance-associated macrophage protein)-like metal ion transporter